MQSLKWMVDELHKHDIEVIIDVVYNHTGEGGLWRQKLFFEFHGSDFDVNLTLSKLRVFIPIAV